MQISCLCKVCVLCALSPDKHPSSGQGQDHQNLKTHLITSKGVSNRWFPMQGRGRRGRIYIFTAETLPAPVTEAIAWGGERERPLGLCRGFSIQVVSGERKDTTMKAGDNLILQIRMKEKAGAFHMSHLLIPSLIHTQTRWRVTAFCPKQPSIGYVTFPSSRDKKWGSEVCSMDNTAPLTSK